MKLSKLVIHHFGAVKEATLYLSDKGLVSIEGKNSDTTGATSNGSGKSTIANSITWCLFGEAGKEIYSDSVVNNIIKKDCFVEITLDDSHRITRYRKHKVGKNGVKVEVKDDTTWIDITKAGPKAVQEQINLILGHDFLTFQASCIAQQDAALDIPAMTDTQLKNLLEKVLPFDDLSEYYNKASKDVSFTKEIIHNINTEITGQESLIEYLREKGKQAYAEEKNYTAKVLKENEYLETLIKEKHEELAKHAFILDSIDVTKIRDTISDWKKAQDALGYSDVGAATALFRSAIRRYEEAKEQYAELDNKCPTCGSETESKEELQKRLLPNLERLKKERQEAKENCKTATENLARFAKIQDTIEGLQEEHRQWTVSDREIKALERERSALEARLVSGSTNPHERTVARLKEDFDKAKAAKAKLVLLLNEETAKLELQEAVQFTYSPKGVRYHMLERVAPTLTDLTNKYLSILTDGAIKANWSTVVKTSTGEYREKFRIDVEMGATTEYGALSGGEKRKVRLACFFALQDLIASRATKNIEIWIGDEIDDSLDTAGVERLMMLLDEKSKHKSTILVISHNELRDWIPNTAFVERKDNFSIVTGYLNDY